MTSCFDTGHFKASTSGYIAPQTWMQYRQVATGTTASKVGTFPVASGGNKDKVLQTLITFWVNSSPIPQWVYGLVTRGGCKVTLTARSRGFLKLSHAGAVGSSAGSLVEVSRVGVGGSAGKAGLFAADSYAIAELRQNAITMPLKPQTAGFVKLNAGQTFTAQIELRFVSELWQSAAIDGGQSQTESSYVTGETRIDLFAIPAL
jgi:hypothetical protein